MVSVKHKTVHQWTSDRLRDEMKKRDIDGLLVSHRSNVRYLSGFSGTNGYVVITQKDVFLVTDVRYELQAESECPDCSIVIAKNTSLAETISLEGLLDNCSRVGYDETHISVASYSNLKKLFQPAQLLRSATWVSALRSVKHPIELRHLRKAAQLADSVFSEILPHIQAGVGERELEAEIRYKATLAGSEYDPFEPIVVSGPRSALIHGKATSRKLRKGDLVILDFGCVHKGYCSDITRTVAIGSISKKKQNIYDAVHAAQTETIKHASSGMTGDTLDAFARNHISQAGYGEYFKHSLGHGLGLQVHESPKVSNRSTELLVDSNVVTIEPGIYIPGVGGVRIEDDVIIRDGSCEVLTKAPKELMVI
jgi:Xaa-Pro aminopeptidase